MRPRITTRSSFGQQLTELLANLSLHACLRLQSALQLCQDQYGNYVIQHTLQFGSEAERMVIMRMLAPNIVAFSMHKCASNVVEKALTHGSVAEREILVCAYVCLLCTYFPSSCFFCCPQAMIPIR